MSYVRYPTLDITADDAVLPGIIFTDVEGGWLVAAAATSAWGDRVLQAGKVTAAPGGLRRARVPVRAREAAGEEREALWQHIHQLRPTRNARQGPDSDLRLIVLEPI